MSLSFSTLSAPILELLSEILDILGQLHTVSTAFTVLREKGSPIGLRIEIEYLLAEQKEDLLVRIPPIIVDLRKKET